MTGREVYLFEVLSQAERLLGLMDRTPGSATYGCLDRQYWHYATTDFPCAEQQESALTLAHLYKIEHAANPYQGSPLLLEWIVAALDFWCAIQHRDGSFSEWYPHEKSMSVTPFSSYAISETLLVLGDSLPNRQRVLACLEKAAAWLIKAKDLRVANHYAASPLALYNISLLSNDQGYAQAAKAILKGLAALQDEEGWFQEYGGADIGYTSVTIYYLANYYRKTGDALARSLLERAVAFCWHFAHPDGSFGGEYGSRNTEYILPHGLEIIANDLPQAAALCLLLRQSLAQGRHVGPRQMDDRYLAYLSYAYLQAYVDASDDLDPGPGAPYGRAIRKTWPHAGLLLESDVQRQLIFNSKKGGAFRITPVSGGRALVDNGVVVKTPQGRLLYSFYLDPHAPPPATPGPWVIERLLAQAGSNLLTPLTNVLQRIFMLTVGRLGRVEALLKDLLRDFLITKLKLSRVRFSRELALHADGCTVVDRLAPLGQIAGVWVGVKGSFVYGPSTRFFQPSSLTQGHLAWQAEKLPAGPADGQLVITRHYDLEGALTHSQLGLERPAGDS